MTLTITVDVADDQADAVAARWPASTWRHVIADALTLALATHETTAPARPEAANAARAHNNVADVAAAFGRAA